MRIRFICLAVAVVTAGGVVLADWLEQYDSSVAPTRDSGEQARQAVRDSIARVRENGARVVQVTRSGRWQAPRLRDDLGDWHAQVSQNVEDGTITGRATVVGAPQFASAKIDGRVDGHSVSGVVTDGSGRELAFFSGSTFAAGMSGTFTTSDGETGTWSYEEPQVQDAADGVVAE